MTDHLTLETYRENLITLCKEVSDFIKGQLNEVSSDDVETKDMNSLVSYVDKEAEKMIVSTLSELTPSAGFVTEEDTVDQPDKKQVWIVDPLDGTTNFLYKIPHFSISIALMEEGEITLGIVYEVVLDIPYTAIKGKGAWMGTQPLKVRDNNDMSRALVITGFPYRRGLDIDASLAVLRYCVINCRGVRRLGSAALDLAYVAAGKIDIYYENALSIWDIAAGALLVTEAGGRMSDYAGENNYLKSGRIISSNGQLHDEILGAIVKAHGVL